MGKEDKKSLLPMTRPLSLLLPLLLHSAPPSEPQYSGPPNGCFPLQQAVVGRGRVYVPFQLSDLREIKKDPGSYTDAPDRYIQAFISVIQTFELAWKDIMLLLDQTLSSEKQ
jgi:hypothetical protein